MIGLYHILSLFEIESMEDGMLSYFNSCNKHCKPIILLFILTFISSILLFSCEKKKPKSIQDKEALKKEMDKSSSEVKYSGTESLAKVIKDLKLFPEYKIDKYEYLDQDSLYKKINGAADGYVKNHGFVGCGYLELKHKLEDVPVILYVMDMGIGIHGYGIYSNERNINYHFVKIGTEGYFDKKGLTFWKNKYYVKIELQGKMDKEKSSALLTTLAGRIAKIIPDDQSILKVFENFPKEGRIERGDIFYMANYDASEHLNDVYEVKYKSSNKKALVFLSQNKNKNDAIDRVKKYIKELNLNGLKTIQPDKDIQGFIGTEPVEKYKITILQSGKNIAGIKGFSKDDHKKMAEAMIQILKIN